VSKIVVFHWDALGIYTHRMCVSLDILSDCTATRIWSCINRLFVVRDSFSRCFGCSNIFGVILLQLVISIRTSVIHGSAIYYYYQYAGYGEEERLQFASKFILACNRCIRDVLQMHIRLIALWYPSLVSTGWREVRGYCSSVIYFNCSWLFI